MNVANSLNSDQSSPEPHSEALKQLARALPKTELHLHIEGSLEPELMFELAKRNNVTLPYQSVEEIRNAYDFSNLQDFLDIYYAGAAVLITEQDFYDLTVAYLKRAADDNIVHVEIFFDPQTHTERDIHISTVINGIKRGLVWGEKELNITHKLILCFLRHLPEEAAVETWESAQPYMEFIDGVGLDSAEKGNPPEKFKNIYETVRESGIPVVAHAGEEGPAEYIRGAIDTLGVVRIDHGVRATEDPLLVAELAESRMPLTVCPLSNQKLKVFPDLRDHNLKTLLNKGLCVMINSDDPAYFGGYLNTNFDAIIDALPLTEQDIRMMMQNSFEASWMPESEKAQFIAKIESFSLS